jgi:hypothetical protein
MVGASARKPTALLVVAAWHEGAPPRLAARITYTVDASRASRVTLTAAGADEVSAAVSEWLGQVEAAARRGDAAVTDE